MNSFNFKKVFEKIQKETKADHEKTTKKTINTSLNSSFHSFQSEGDKKTIKLKDMIFDKKTMISSDSVNRNIRNISSLKKSRILLNKNCDEKCKIPEEQDFMEEEDPTPSFYKDKFRDISPIQEVKEFENDNCFLPMVKSSVNYSLFHDLNPNINTLINGKSRIFKNLVSKENNSYEITSNNPSSEFPFFKTNSSRNVQKNFFKQK